MNTIPKTVYVVSWAYDDHRKETRYFSTDHQNEAISLFSFHSNWFEYDRFIKNAFVTYECIPDNRYPKRETIVSWTKEPVKDPPYSGETSIDTV